MVAFGHTAVGAVIGVAAFEMIGQGDIAAGLITTGILGVASHYITDAIPHGHFFTDPKKYEKLILWVILFDLILPVLILLAAAHLTGKGGNEILYVLFGIGGAQLPDIFDGLKKIRLLPKINILQIENQFHQMTHWHGREEKALLFSRQDIWQGMIYFIALVTIIK